MTNFGDWLDQALKRRGKGSKTALAKAVPTLSASKVSKILSGERDISGRELRQIEFFLGERVPAEIAGMIVDDHDSVLPEPESVPIIGVVAAGVWREIGMGSGSPRMKQDENPFPTDPRFPFDAQFDLIVEGPSLNLIAPEGHRLRCIDVMRSGIEIQDGDLVIVQRSRGTDMVETTAKRLRVTANGKELWPESTDPRFQEPLKLTALDQYSQDEIRITAVVIHVHLPMMRRGL